MKTETNFVNRTPQEVIEIITLHTPMSVKKEIGDYQKTNLYLAEKRTIK